MNGVQFGCAKMNHSSILLNSPKRGNITQFDEGIEALRKSEIMISGQILIVDQDSHFREQLGNSLSAEKIGCMEAGSLREAARLIELNEFDTVLLAQRLPDGNGLDLIPAVLNTHPATPVIVMTAYSSIASAVEAMKRGAFDYLPKPVSKDQLLVTLGKAFETRNLRQEMARITSENMMRYGLDAIIGQGPAIAGLREALKKIVQAPSTTVLIQGESGSGKELVAKALHYTSRRASFPFVPINCSAIPESLLESELFGYESGAFTDAKSTKRGLFEVGNNGTVFLDEIAELNLGLQAKILRFLEEQTFKRVGGTRDITVDVRVLAATNVNLERAVSEGRFREDLYYRLKVVPVIVPPLRERTEDIPLLVRYFIDHFNKRFRKRFDDVTPEALRKLCMHPWPGNVRELKNAIERVIILEEGPLIEASQLILNDGRLPPTEIKPATEIKLCNPSADHIPENLSLEQIEIKALVQALERTNGNQTNAAKALDISRDKLRYLIRKYGLKMETRVVSSRARIKSASYL
ncbi:MAG: sigma-54-dependent Fis family transcriptional regulator [Planctomycetes bacterium]|nr:sigma-54-dependent Fis family transcriptional regulator [Planctomycetota bacterium]